MNKIDDIVRLNVGGDTSIMVRKSLLCEHQGTTLEAMFSGRHSFNMVNDSIFVERDVEGFKLLINYLRNFGKLVTKNQFELDLLNQELEFWGLNKPIE